MPSGRTVGRCTPRANARLVLRTGPLVLSRVGGATWACRGSKQRRVSADTTAIPLGDHSVQFYDGVLDVSSGKRRELPGMQVASDGSAVVGVASWGVSAWPNVTLAPGPASEPAVASDADDSVAYWLDGAAAPQMRVL